MSKDTEATKANAPMSKDTEATKIPLVFFRTPQWRVGSFTLEPSRSVPVNTPTGPEAQVSPGIVLDFASGMQADDFSKIDVRELNVCKRANNRRAPEEVAELIMASDHYKNGDIIDEVEYRDLVEARTKLEEERAKMDEKLREMKSGKRGRRGVAA